MSGRTTPVFPPAHSVKDLLARPLPSLMRVTDHAARQSFWSEWLSGKLPPELARRIAGASEQDGQLVVFAESAAWCARLRYALRELDAQLRAASPGLGEVRVRVQPRGAAPRP
jgi:hypothetical protein